MSTRPMIIRHQATLQAPRARVWRALTDAAEFGAWFRVRLKGGFAPGGRCAGHITYPGYEHVRFEVEVVRMEAERLFSWRWHPYAVDPAIDYAAERPTLVEFHLEDQGRGTLLRVVESGFEALPDARRDEAFRMNDDGWAEQMYNIRRHVDGEG